MKDRLIMWDDIELLDYIGNIERKYVPYIDSYEYKDNACISKIPIDDNIQSEGNLLSLFSEEEIRLADTRPAVAV